MNVVRKSSGSYELGGNILDGSDNNLKKFRGYCGMGMYQPQNAANVGSIWRSAFGFGVDFLFCIGGRYKKQKSDTTAAHRHIPLWTFEHYHDFLQKAPTNVNIVAIDNNRSNRQPVSLYDFKHPEQAAYIVGAEVGGIHPDIIQSAQHYIYVPTQVCLNVACCASIVLSHRFGQLLEKS